MTRGRTMPAARALLAALWVALTPMAAMAEDDPGLPDSIGTAEMLADGTLALHLRAESGTSLGDAYFHVQADDPHYAEIKRHVGDIRPGETKPFRPWPEDGADPAAKTMEPQK
jgi:hypothetical protein